MLENLARMSTACLSPCIDALFTSCDDFFFDLASRAKSNNDQNLYFEFLREIRAKKSELKTDFCKRVEDGFTSVIQGTAFAEEADAPSARAPEAL